MTFFYFYVQEICGKYVGNMKEYPLLYRLWDLENFWPKILTSLHLYRLGPGKIPNYPPLDRYHWCNLPLYIYRLCALEKNCHPLPWRHFLSAVNSGSSPDRTTSESSPIWEEIMNNSRYKPGNRNMFHALLYVSLAIRNSDWSGSSLYRLLYPANELQCPPRESL